VSDRLLRLRRTPAMRALFAEARLDASRLCLPVFVHDEPVSTPIATLPGVQRHAIVDAVALAKHAVAAGIRSILVFGVPASKDADARSAADTQGPAQRAITEIKAACGDELVVIADTCLCAYTDDGHCLRFDADGRVDAARTLDALAAAAVSQAAAGADVIAPSDMMDGRVAVIRDALDAAGHGDTVILSYAAKYASSFYGPFRDAADCAPTRGDRRGYQIEPSAKRQGLASIERDLAEGADAVMVKPALPYLDVVAAARERIDVPLWAYQVSGEHAMLHAAADRGMLDLRAATLEALTSIVRAGADVVVTYAALDAAAWLQEQR
jgi:porphobilinogen synthase